jgi:molybdopterin-guanine dinucleotide biosynthesis protein A, proteobacterial
MDSYKKKICAVIMTGGKSSRMGGGIKTLMQFNKKIIFERILESLQNQINNIIINNNDMSYQFKKYNLPIIEDKIKGYLGPLAGIHASLVWVSKNLKNIEWIVSVPGDTPFIPDNLVEKLYNKAESYKKNIIIAKSNEKIHPIVGIWNVNLLQKLEKAILEGERKIIIWAKKNQLDYQEFINDRYDPFFNINYNADIDTAKKIEAKFIFGQKSKNADG